MRAADADILIIPGLNDSGPDHWQTRWQIKLSTARRVKQKDWRRPCRHDWEAGVTSAIDESVRPVVLIAHSLGVVASLFALRERHEKIAGAFFVAPPSETVIGEIPVIDREFLPIPRHHLKFPAIMVGSGNDPYADYQFTKDLAEELGAKFIDAGPAGHINVESGHGPWPEGLLAFAHFIAKL
ncbi:MAG: alpha/beta hydrolase [Methylocystaceae bacterium]|jgi:hypothetical protein|nr:alpha/beta hydrolase [Methylocystaceae bacterium]NBT96552.1 alpha/beta hydrolase [Methylocystaceae bacterium]